jgi:hypothetical protein
VAAAAIVGEMVQWRKLFRKRRSEILRGVAGFLYFLILLSFMAWLANSARLSGERWGWIPWLS